MAIPGLKVVAPSTPADVVGLMAAAIRDADPVIFCEHKALFATKGEVPDGEHVVPLGRAAVVREGADCTIVALAAMVPAGGRGRRAAPRPTTASTPRSSTCARLVPLDVATILASVEKTSRLFTVEENPRLLRLGRRDRLDRRRRGVLEPRRADRADHHPARPAAVRGVARGPRDPDAWTGSSTRSGAGSRRRGDGDGGRAARSGSSGRAGWARRWRGRSRGPDGRSSLYNRSARRAREALAGELGARVAAPRPRSPRPRTSTITMLADDAAVDGRLRRAGRAARRARRRGRCSST